MNDNDFGAKTQQYLNAGLARIEGDRLERLRAARVQAMAAYREPVAALGLMTVAGHRIDIKYDLIQKTLILAPLVALLVALAAANLASDNDPNAEIGELDAALLTGELPIDAFLDKDFDAWLKANE